MINNLKETIKDIANDLRPQIEAIEAGLPTTLNNYDKYMGIITLLARKRPEHATIVALALLRAGAHPHGVINALKLTFPQAADELCDSLAVLDRS